MKIPHHPGLPLALSGLVCVLSLAASAAGRGGAAAVDPNYTGPAAYAPVTQPKDRQDMLNLLGIKQVRRGLSSTTGTGPLNCNMSEDHVDEWPPGYQEAIGKPRPPHASTTLPDLMTCKDGTKVTDAKTWLEKRRPEIVEDFEREVYGRIPKDVPKVVWQVASNTVTGNVRTKVLRGVVDNSAYPQVSVTIQAQISTPANATGPVPLILTFGGGGGGMGGGGMGGAPGGRAAPGAAPGGALPGALLNTNRDLLAQWLGQDHEQWFEVAAPAAGRAAGGVGGIGGASGPTRAAGGVGGVGGASGPGAGRGAAGGGASYTQMALQRGWGYGTINNSSVQPNNWSGGGIIALTAKGKPHQPDDWGTLRAWGWGVSRLCDYLATDKDVDPKCVALEGHSFLGKTTLVSTVFEPRIFTAFVSSSGTGGAKIYRRNFGEPAEGIGGTQEYYWMAGNWQKYCGPLTVDDLPVDAHEFLALQAPRPIFISAGQVSGDGWQDPKGMYLAANLASPAYEILGKKGVCDESGKRVTEFPQVEQAGQPAQFGPALIGGDIAYRQHSGGHVDAPNWPTFFTFLEHYWKVIPAPATTTPAPQ